MTYRLTFRGKDIGSLDLRADGFSVEGITDAANRKALQNLLDACYARGLSGGVERDVLREDTLQPDDPRFPIELSIRLSGLGYRLA